MDKHTINQNIYTKIRRLRAGNPLRVVDLFSGCGGISLGFHRAGYEILGGIELDTKAARTYARNFFPPPGSDRNLKHAQARDITELTPERFEREVLLPDNPDAGVDVIVGGPPCQAFSRIGRAKLRNLSGCSLAFLQDERSNLHNRYLVYVEHFKPLAVVMENVTDIMNFGGENIAEVISSSLDKLGYQCRYTILNAAHYGVPQSRDRFILIAVHKAFQLEPCFPEPTHGYEIPEGYHNARQVALKKVHEGHNRHYKDPDFSATLLPPAVTTQAALADLPIIIGERDVKKRGARKLDEIFRYRTDVVPSDFVMEMRRWPGFSTDDSFQGHVTRYLKRDFPIFARMQHGDQYPQAYEIAESILDAELERLKIKRDGEEYQKLRNSIVPPYSTDKFPNKWCKLTPHRPSHTLTAHIGKDTYSHIHYDSSQGRVITVREAARLQSFPDGFVFEGAMSAAFRQIGNAVPPLLAFALAKKLKEELEAATQPVTS